MGKGSVRRWSMVLATGVVLAVALSACSHTSMINTEPEDAEVYINGVPVGRTPTVYKSHSGTPETYYLKIEKPGYQTLKNVTIERRYRADLSLVLLVLAFVPYFFSARLEDQYVFHLIPEGGQPIGTSGPAPYPGPASGTAAVSEPPSLVPPPAPAGTTAPPERLAPPPVLEPPPENS